MKFFVGYVALIKRFHLQVIPPFRASYQKKPLQYPFEHLLFAIRHEGINLGILKKLFAALPQKEVESFIKENIFRKEVKKIWYLYELLTGFRCAIPDSTSRTYVELVDSRYYYTGRPKKSRRHRIIDNLLGPPEFCPLVRKTKKLKAFEKKGLEKRARAYMKRCPLQLSIAHTRNKRLMNLIENVAHIPRLTKRVLISTHNKAVDYGFAERCFRKHQNYLCYSDGTICRISPKPKDVPLLMEGLLECYERTASLHPVIRAAILSFGFSIIHPFEDGNGRVQLFLLYYILFHSSFKSFAHIFKPHLEGFFYLPGFNPSIEQFDTALSSLVEYTLHKNKRLTVHGNTCDLYRSIDFTPMAEFLFRTVEKELHARY